MFSSIWAVRIDFAATIPCQTEKAFSRAVLPIATDPSLQLFLFFFGVFLGFFASVLFALFYEGGTAWGAIWGELHNSILMSYIYLKISVSRLMNNITLSKEVWKDKGDSHHKSTPKTLLRVLGKGRWGRKGFYFRFVAFRIFISVLIHSFPVQARWSSVCRVR